jgi:hypothetical protein
MRPVLLFLLSITLIEVSGQNAPDTVNQITVGYNTFPVILASELGSGHWYGANYGYQVGYKFSSGRWRKRIGLNVNNSSSANVPSDKYFTRLVNLGIEKVFIIGKNKRSEVFLGGDLIAIHNTLTYPRGLNILKDKFYGIGGGPVMGYAFNITSRFGLSTELNFDVLYGKEDRITYDNSGLYFDTHRLLGIIITYKL